MVSVHGSSHCHWPGRAPCIGARSWQDDRRRLSRRIEGNTASCIFSWLDRDHLAYSWRFCSRRDHLVRLALYRARTALSLVGSAIRCHDCWPRLLHAPTASDRHCDRSLSRAGLIPCSLEILGAPLRRMWSELRTSSMCGLYSLRNLSASLNSSLSESPAESSHALPHSLSC